MKKKQVIVIAVVLAVALLTGTAVYAIGNLSPESNQANKPVEQPPLSSAAAEAEELQAPLTAEQVDISAFTVPIGTEAEQILRNTLVQKQMTEQEIQYYNALPSEIKMLTRAEAIERLEDIDQWLEENEKEFSEYTDEEIEQLNAVHNEQLACKLYIDCLATGSEYSMDRINSTIERFDSCLSDTINKLTIWEMDTQRNRNRKAMLEFILEVLDDIKVKAQNGDYDYDAIMTKLDCIENYWDLHNEIFYLESISEEMFDDFAQRYESGESIESILG